MSKTENLKKVFDTTTLQGKLVSLNEEQASTFIDYMVDESKLLKAARFVKMLKPIKTIAKLFAGGRFLHPGKSGIGLDGSKFQQAQSETLELKSKMVRGGIFITDEELQDNIEGNEFKTSFMKLVAKKVANELEEISMYARPVDEDNALSTLDQFTGFKYKLLTDGNVLRASDTGTFPDRLVNKSKFAKMMKVLATKYRQQVQYLTSSDVVIDYGLLFDTVADSNVRNELRSSILGKSIIEVPLMRVDEPVLTATSTTVATTATANGTLNQVVLTSATGINIGDSIVYDAGLVTEKVYEVIGKATNTLTLDRPIEYTMTATHTVHKATLDGTDAILTNPLNFIYGVQTGDGAIEFETERVPSLGYKYHFKMRLDFQIENPEAATILTDLKVA